MHHSERPTPVATLRPSTVPQVPFPKAPQGSSPTSTTEAGSADLQGEDRGRVHRHRRVGLGLHIEGFSRPTAVPEPPTRPVPAGAG